MSLEIRYNSMADQDYYRLLPLQKSLKALRKLTKQYDRIAADAREIAEKMTEEDFIEFRDGLLKEKQGEFAGEVFMEKYGAILLPTVLLQVGMTAKHFCVPFGVAYIRMKEHGQIVEDSAGRASIVQPKKNRRTSP